MKAVPPRDPENKQISVTIAARMLGVSSKTVHRYLESGLLRGCRPYTGAWYSVSERSVLELKAKRQRQVHQSAPLFRS